MSFSDRYTKAFRYLLPTPFTIAVLLTVITFVTAFLLTSSPGKSNLQQIIELLNHWENGLWENGLMVFAMQMMLMLVLGHTLALTSSVNRIITFALQYCTNTSRTAFVVTFLTICIAFFNWGLGLIFGAIFARKAGEYASSKGIPLNYPIIGAAGYSGLMVWHGGLSGSSLTKVAESGHIRQIMTGIIQPEQLSGIPAQISFSATVFSPMNILVSILLLVLLPSAMYFIGKKSPGKTLSLSTFEAVITTGESSHIGMEKLDRSPWASALFSIVILCYAFYKAIIVPEEISLNFITPNFINLVLLGLAILLHGSFQQFLNAIDSAISGVSGILIQFPLYFGIMGIMKGSGLVDVFSEFFVSISNAVTFPIFTFFSAGLVNIFVPSGGGQWAVQGPIIVKTAMNLDIPLSKSILAMAYGDQLTNMLQPFWALPLLGITGLKAKDILPYTLYLMLIGAIIFIGGLLLF